MEEKEKQKLQNKIDKLLITNRKLKSVYQLNQQFKARNEVLKSEIMRKNDDINKLKADYKRISKVNNCLEFEIQRLNQIIDEELSKL